MIPCWNNDEILFTYLDARNNDSFIFTYDDDSEDAGEGESSLFVLAISPTYRDSNLAVTVALPLSVLSVALVISYCLVAKIEPRSFFVFFCYIKKVFITKNN